MDNQKEVTDVFFSVLFSCSSLYGPCFATLELRTWLLRLHYSIIGGR